MYHADEVRDFNQVPKDEKVNISKQELGLGVGLIDKVTSEVFIPRITKTIIAFACSPRWIKRAKEKRSPLHRPRRNVAAKSSTSWKP